jgi:hypothetical protein
MSITRLSGGLTPADGSDPRTFPTIFNAAADYIENGFRYAGTRYYTSDGSFAKADPLGTGDIGLRAIRVRLVGGGGGGSGCAATAAGESACGAGGGGGAYSEKFITDIDSLSASESIVRGAGGSGGAAGANHGTDGGTSSAFTVTAPGGLNTTGLAGIASATPAYTAGRGAGGPRGANADFDIAGMPGGSGYVIAGGELTNMDPNGGHAANGLGIGGSSPTSNTNGINGAEYGGGGMGGRNRQASQTAKSGGNGSNGIVIVDCYV